MDDKQFRHVTTLGIIFLLAVLAFFLLKPILLAIVSGVILAFVFNPVYNRIYKKIKSKNVSASIVCLILIILIVIPTWLLTPIIIEQSLKLFIAAQQVDLVEPLQNLFPSLFASEKFTSEISPIISNFITRIANSLTNSLAQIILNFPSLFLQFLVAAFTFFFVLRDKEALNDYIKSLLPFSKEVQNKIFESSKVITSSVIYGQVLIGIIQGVLVGIGFFIFGVPNALFLTLLAILAGIFPIIGTTIVWLPVAIYLIIAGNTLSVIGITIFGLLSSSIDNFLRPLLVSRQTKMHSSVVLIGMIGGLFLFGILGFILGPLILAYLLIILEIYRNKKDPHPLVEN